MIKITYIMDDKYTENIEDFVNVFNSQKARLVDFLKKHFKENID